MKVGVYELEAEIGRGGMGIVYRSRAPDGRPVAVKVLPPTDAEKRARFEREQRLLGSFTEEDGFVPLLDSGNAPSPYLVMPFVAGGTLRNLLEGGPLGIQETLELGVVLARSLGRAHERGIVHRDMKPENVLFTAERKPLIADLGLAKHFDRSSDGGSKSVSLSKPGSFRGTPGYVAPEQMDDARSVDARADVFALGAMLYECLAGAPAFEGGTVLQMLARAADGSFDPLCDKRPDVPEPLALVVERALAPAPADRFADGHAFARALSETTGKAPRRLPRAIVPLAFVLACGLVGWHAIASSSEPAPPAPPPIAPVTPARPGPPPAPAQAPTRLPAAPVKAGDLHSGRIRAVAISPDGSRILSGGEDGQLRTWAPDGHLLDAERVGARVDTVAFSPRGRASAYATEKAIVARSAAYGTSHERTWPHKERVLALGLAEGDGTLRIGAAEADGAVEGFFWGAQEPDPLAGGTYMKADPGVLSAAVSVGDILAAFGSANARVEVRGTQGESVSVRLRGEVEALAATPLLERLIAGDRFGEVRVLERGSQALSTLAELETGNRVRSVGIAASGQVAAAGCEDGSLHLIDLRVAPPRSRALALRGVLPASVTALAVAADGSFVVAASGSSLSCWSVESGACVWEQQAP